MDVELFIFISREEVPQRIIGLSNLASRGNIHVGLVVVSVALVLLRSFKYKHQLEQATPVSIPFEICSQLARAVTFSLACVLAASQPSQWPTSLLSGYAFLLGILGTVLWKSRRRELLRHVNILLLTALFIVVLYELPTILLEIPPELQLDLSLYQIALLVALSSCNLITLFTPQDWTPPSVSWDLIQRQPNEGPSPEETCSYFSYYVSYGWLTSLVWKGRRRSISFEDLPSLPSFDEPLVWLPRVLDARRRGVSTLLTIMILLRKEFILMVLFSAIAAIFEVLVPVAMYQLLEYLSKPELAVVTPWVWVCLLFLGPNFRAIAYQQSLFIITRMSVRLKISLVQELFQKVIQHGRSRLQPRPSPTSRHDLNMSSPISGEIETLISYDIDAIIAARDILLCCVVGPVTVVLALILLYQMLGWPSITGLAVLLVCLPLPMFLAQRLSAVQVRIMQATEARIAKIAEYLPAIRTIKYFAWENAIFEKIDKARRLEQCYMWKRSLYTVEVIMSTELCPLFANLVMFTCYVLGTNQRLTSPIAFTSLTLVETIRLQFILMSSVIRKGSQAKASLHRLDQYVRTVTEVQRHPIGPPSFMDATLSLSHSSQFKLMHLNIQFIENGFNVITGPSGSGKTSLLLSLLGETVLESGEVRCPRDVAYCSQTAWLQHDNIRNNIIFYTDFNQTRYDTIIDTCCLIKDFEQFPNGDLTNIGEDGIMLSGGQRQRIALARAIYSNTPSILLDDVFSALDVATAVHIFNHCFCSNLLQNRLTILVTQIPWIVERADLVVKLNGGSVTLAEHRQNMVRIPISALLVESNDVVRLNYSGDTANVSNVKVHPAENSSFSEANCLRKSAKTLIFRYMVAFGGHKYALFAFFTALLAQTLFFAMMLWLSVWVSASDGEDATHVGFYLGVYAATIALFNLLTGVECVVFRNGAWNAAKILHQELVRAVFGVSLSWYNAISFGRINNRFSRDIDSLDGRIVDSVQRSIGLLLRLLFRITAIGSIMPIFALPTTIICLFGYFVGDLYTQTAASVKRFASEAQSPVFAHFSEVLTGLIVIRARDGMAEIMQTQLAAKLRVYAKIWEVQFNLNRWVYVRSDFVSSLIGLGAGIIAVTQSGSMSTGFIGLSLTNAVTLGQTTIQLVRALNELEIEMTSFDRVQEYVELPSEEERKYYSIPPPACWPLVGTLEFRNVTARYTKDGPDIIKDVSFQISAGERVAIVGRTGSGKSTLALSCLRAVNIVSGNIMYDEIDITQLPLHRLRQSLTIIPQDTILFSGNVAENLNPTNTFDQHHLVNALAACNRIPAFNNHNASDSLDSKISLSTQVVSGGQNFSHGQRQILGLARALVKQSKVIILDEATASMDYDTDSAIQEVLRAELRESTLITIAHRLRTIIDYDRVIVMSEGKIAEMGTPEQLYRSKGIFADMVEQGGDTKEFIKSFRL